MAIHIRRRELIGTVGGVVAWPLAARAQPNRMRVIGVLMPLAEGDQEAQARSAAFREGLQKLGWTDPHNVRIHYRWAAGDTDRLRAYAEELVGMTPDALVGSGTSASAALRRASRTIPTVFTQVSDPVGAGLVTNLARPGGNITGFVTYEQAIGVKWLELLTQIAPGITRVMVIYDSANPAAPIYSREIEARASTFGVELSLSALHDTAQIEPAITTFAGAPSGGLIVLPAPLTNSHRELIIALAARHRLPAVYGFRFYVTSGGLASYGSDNIDLWRRAASYTDRILRGERPGDLPVQFADKFELIINMKTAKMLGLDPPISLLARTDEVIE